MVGSSPPGRGSLFAAGPVSVAFLGLRAAGLDPTRVARAGPAQLPRAIDPPPGDHRRAARGGRDPERRGRRLGACGAWIGLAVAGRRVLRYVNRAGQWVEYPDDAFIAGRAFTEQRASSPSTPRRADPEHAAVYERTAATTIIAAPITVEDRRLGVLIGLRDRAPIFVEDDLWLLELIADHTAVLLEAALSPRSRAASARGRSRLASRRSSCRPPRTTCARR